MLELLNVKVNTLGMCIKACWWLIMIGLMGICMACGSSPIEEEDHEQNAEQPDLKNMVLIPAGEFLMGSKEGEGAFDEHPQHTVYLDEYYIDKYEVTNAQFQEFVEAIGYVTDAERKGRGEVWNPKEWGKFKLKFFNGVNWKRPNAWLSGATPDRHPTVWENYNIANRNPVVQVSRNDAEAYCRWTGKRLPTEAEWEKAAMGNKGFTWPWGNEFNPQKANVTAYTNMGSVETAPVG